MRDVKHLPASLRRASRALLSAIVVTLGCADPPASPDPTMTQSSPAPSDSVIDAIYPPVVPAVSAAPIATSMDPRAFVPAVVPAETRVAIVGAGFAGLLTAYRLRKAGIDVHVLEAQPRVGGRVATAYYPGGAAGEFGFQELWDDNPIYPLAKELGVAFEEPGKGEAAFSRFLYDEDDPAKKGAKRSFVFSPGGAGDKAFFEALPSRGKKADPAAWEAFDKWLRNAAELRKRAVEKGLADPEIKRLQKTTFGAWVHEANLDPKIEEFISMTVDCEVASTSEEYSALFGLLELGPFVENHQSYHAKGGNQRIPEAIAAAIGPHITTGAKVMRVQRPSKDRPGRGEIAVEYMIDGHVGVLRAERVVLTVPWTRLHEIDIQPPLSREKWDGIDGERDTGNSKRAQLPGLARGKYVVVHLLVDRKQGDALFRDKKTKETPFPLLSAGKLGVIYGVRGEGEARSDFDVFGLLVYGENARNLHMEPVDRVQAIAVAELERTWPGFGKLVRGTYVYSYHPAAIPVWPPGRSPIDDLSKGLWKPERGLYLAGDYLINAHSDGAARSAVCQSDRLVLDLANKPAPTGLCHYVPAPGR